MKMATRGKKQPTGRQIKTDLTVFRHPLNVIVEKFGDGSARVCGEMSKESLRDLLMPSLTFVRRLPTTEPDTDKRLVEKVQRKFREKDSGRDAHRRSNRRAIQSSAVREEVTELSDSARRKIRRHLKEQKQREKKEVIIDGDRIRQTEHVDKGTAPFDDYYDQRSWGWSEYDEQSPTEISRSLISCPSSDWESPLLPHDEKWLRRNIVRPLRLALGEIVAKQPNDPVSYLSFWLLNFRMTQEYETRKRQDDDLLRMERALLVKVSIADVDKPSIEIRKEEEVLGE